MSAQFKRLPLAIKRAGITAKEYASHIQSAEDYCSHPLHAGTRWVPSAAMSDETTGVCRPCRNARETERRRATTCAETIAKGTP